MPSSVFSTPAKIAGSDPKGRHRTPDAEAVRWRSLAHLPERCGELQLAGLAALVLGALLAFAPDVHPEPSSGRFAVATENRTATHEALAILKNGGDAVDAAVCAALLGGVASPSSSGLGGGGFAVLWRGREKTPSVLDFRETAPQSFNLEAFEGRARGQERGRSVGVPGEPRGLHELWQRFGKKRWQDLVERAAYWAESGFPVGVHLGRALETEAQDLRKDPELASIYLPRGRPAIVGQRLKNPNLAATLRRLAAEGPKAIYEGPIAQAIVRGAQSQGGELRAEDLKAYKTVTRKPLHVRWEGYDIYTMPAPSAGGLLLAETLGSFSLAEFRQLEFQSPTYAHVLAEVFRGALADRARYVGDPEHVPTKLEPLFSESRLRARRAELRIDRTHKLPEFASLERGTHQIVTADAAGNLVALTTTVNGPFGAKLAAPTTGFILNNELDDFTSPEMARALGVDESPNRARARARPVSSMTPTVVVKNGAPIAALGGSGGLTIATNVTQVLLAHLAFQKPVASAVALPRFYVPLRGKTLLVEEGTEPSVIKDLEARGEEVGLNEFKSSAVQIIAGQTGAFAAASDPRKHGSAEVAQ